MKVAKSGAKAGRLINYSFGPGHGNEHTNPHTIAGTVHYPGNDRATIKQIISDLELNQNLWPTVDVPGGHVWHASLSLAADESAPTDAKWAAIAEDYVKEMEFDSAGKAAIQWTAINHGVSKDGNPHIHIVMSRIRADGTKVNDWQSQAKSQRVALKLEQTHGLRVLQSRQAALGAGSVPYSGGEAGKARATGQPIERVDIERRVRAALAASTDEAEFVRRVRSDGLVVRPFPDKGAVTGWSIGVPTDGKPIFYTGGKIARDLTLPKIRETLGAGAGNADAEWRGGQGGQPVLVGGRERQRVAVAPDLVAKVEGELFSLGNKLANATPEQYAQLSGEIAGAFAAASVAVEGKRIGQLGRASREIGAWSQTRHGVVVPSRQGAAGRGLALLMLQAADPTGPIGQAIMVRQLTEMVMALRQLHRASRAAAGGLGRNAMTQPDAVDQASEHGVTITLTTGALVGAQWAQKHRQRIAAGGPKRGLDFRSPSEFGERNPLPRGLQEMISAEEWQGMDYAQQRMVDPDRVGRWATDYTPDTPGAKLRTTGDQLERIEIAARAAGVEPPSWIGESTREKAAEWLRRFEDQAGPDVVGQAYLDAGLVHRQVHENAKGERSYELVFPGAQGAVGAAKLPDPTPVTIRPVMTVTNQTVLTDPSTWKSQHAAVTPAQAGTLRKWGFEAEEIAKLDKGAASSVIKAISDHGDTDAKAVDKAYEKAVAAMIQTPPVAQSQQPPVVPLAPDPGGHTR